MTDQQTPNTPTDHEPSEQAIVEQPRIGIVHLMLWTAGTAVLLSIMPYLRQFGDPGVVDALTVNVAIWAILNGPAVASLAIYVWRRLHRVPYPTQPGEWLLLLLGVEALCLIFAWLSILIMQDWNESMGMVYLVPLVVAQLVAAIPAVVAAFRVRQSRAWKACFVAFACAHVLELVQDLGYWSVQDWMLLSMSIVGIGVFLAFVITSVSFVIAILLDRRRRVSRGWLHVTGVVVCVAQGAWWLLVRFLPF